LSLIIAQLQSICLDSSEVVTMDSPGRSRAYTEGASAIDGDDMNIRVRKSKFMPYCWVYKPFCLLHPVW